MNADGHLDESEVEGLFQKEVCKIEWKCYYIAGSYNKIIMYTTCYLLYYTQ